MGPPPPSLSSKLLCCKIVVVVIKSNSKVPFLVLMDARLPLHLMFVFCYNTRCCDIVFLLFAWVVVNTTLTAYLVIVPPTITKKYSLQYTTTTITLLLVEQQGDVFLCLWMHRDFLHRVAKLVVL